MRRLSLALSVVVVMMLTTCGQSASGAVREAAEASFPGQDVDLIVSGTQLTCRQLDRGSSPLEAVEGASLDLQHFYLNVGVPIYCPEHESAVANTLR